jgi:hypothetical protein
MSIKINSHNATDYVPIDDKDVSNLIPYILIGAIVVCGIIGIISMCCRETKHQTNYVKAVKARKRGDKVEWL